MELEIKHLVGYLPYGLKVLYRQKTVEIVTLKNTNRCQFYNCDDEMQGVGLEFIMPILRPLSDIKEYFEPIFETDKEVNEYLSYEATSPFSVEEILNYKFEYLPYGTCQVLLKHHFDLFGLIEKGLAIDVNSVVS